MSSSAIRRVSWGVRGGDPAFLAGPNLPPTSMCGRLPGEKIRSLTRVEARNIAESKVAAGIGLAESGLGRGILAGLSRGVLLVLLELTFLVRGPQVTEVIAPGGEAKIPLKLTLPSEPRSSASAS